MQSAQSTWRAFGTDLAHSKGQGTPEGEDQLVDATAKEDQLHHLAQVVVKEGVLHSTSVTLLFTCIPPRGWL